MKLNTKKFGKIFADPKFRSLPNCAHARFRPSGIAPTRDCAHAGLRPRGIAPTRGCERERERERERETERERDRDREGQRETEKMREEWEREIETGVRMRETGLGERYKDRRLHFIIVNFIIVNFIIVKNTCVSQNGYIYYCTIQLS